MFSRLFLIVVLVGSSFGTLHAADSFRIIVMDPLSKPLSCDCVKGYAQRRYELLGDFLSKRLGRTCTVTWHESLVEAVKETGGAADLVIGKHSVVLHDAKEMDRVLQPIAQLTGRTGSVAQQGLIVVRQKDPATKAADLKDYKIFFGPAEAEEKSSAPMALLRAAGIQLAAKPVRYGACSEAAIALMELPEDAKAAAVISSYAEPLLEGCGSIKKGDLRVLARTKDVPFITAFTPAKMDSELRAAVKEALAYVSTESKLMIGLETLAGFEPWVDPKDEKKKKLMQQKSP